MSVTKLVLQKNNVLSELQWCYMSPWTSPWGLQLNMTLSNMTDFSDLLKQQQCLMRHLQFSFQLPDNVSECGMESGGKTLKREFFVCIIFVCFCLYKRFDLNSWYSPQAHHRCVFIAYYGASDKMSTVHYSYKPMGWCVCVSCNSMGRLPSAPEHHKLWFILH